VDSSGLCFADPGVFTESPEHPTPKDVCQGTGPSRNPPYVGVPYRIGVTENIPSHIRGGAFWRLYVPLLVAVMYKHSLSLCFFAGLALGVLGRKGSREAETSGLNLAMVMNSVSTEPHW